MFAVGGVMNHVPLHASMHDLFTVADVDTLGLTLERSTDVTALQVVVAHGAVLVGGLNGAQAGGLAVDDDGELLGARGLRTNDIGMIGGNRGGGIVRRHLVELAVVLQDVGVGGGGSGVVQAGYRAREAVACACGGLLQDVGLVGFHLYVLAAELWHTVGSNQVRLVGFELILRIREMDCAVVAAREGVGLEAVGGQLVGQADGGLSACGERALVGGSGGDEVDADGQRLAVGEAEVVARPAVVLLIIIYVVGLCLAGLAVGARLLAQRLCPVALVGAAGLQLMSHIAALELLGGYPVALCLAAGVEVVAVVDARKAGALVQLTFRAEGEASFVVVEDVVGAEVEAVVQRAGGIFVPMSYKSGYSSICTAIQVGRGVEVSLDEAVVNGDMGSVIRPLKYACQ